MWTIKYKKRENFYESIYEKREKKLMYWKTENAAEVDFIIYNDDGIIPIEVKANDNVSSKSLSVYVKRYNPKYSIRISSKNFGFANGIKSIPLYATFCIKN